LNFLRLLLPDDHVKSVGLRTFGEFEELFQVYASAYKLWVIVGHGTKSGGLCFTRGSVSTSSSLATALAPHAASPRTFLFLSCHTGGAAFAKSFSSKTDLCDCLIAPFGALHSAVASQFAQTFLSYRYLEGSPIGSAFNKAAQTVPSSTKFRRWRNGALQG
jgi:hypothetical protein